MSETVEYEIYAEGFATRTEAEEFLKLCRAWQEPADDASISGNDGKVCAEYILYEGWRGGGMTCEELLRQGFEKWLKGHPHVIATIHCRYVEQPPVETIRVEAGEWKNAGVM